MEYDDRPDRQEHFGTEAAAIQRAVSLGWVPDRAAPGDPLTALRAEVEAAVGPMERPMHRRRKREAAVSTDDLIRTYATTLQGIYDDRTGGFHSFVGVLAKFGKELLARDGDDRIDALRAEVEALQEEAWCDYTDAERIDDLNAEQRALGRCRMADKVLDLIDKHREGQ